MYCRGNFLSANQCCEMLRCKEVTEYLIHEKENDIKSRPNIEAIETVANKYNTAQHIKEKEKKSPESLMVKWFVSVLTCLGIGNDMVIDIKHP